MICFIKVPCFRTIRNFALQKKDIFTLTIFVYLQLTVTGLDLPTDMPVENPPLLLQPFQPRVHPHVDRGDDQSGYDPQDCERCEHV